MGGGVEPFGEAGNSEDTYKQQPFRGLCVGGSDRCALGDPWCITGLSRSAQEAGIKPGPPFKAFPPVQAMRRGHSTDRR